MDSNDTERRRQLLVGLGASALAWGCRAASSPDLSGGAPDSARDEPVAADRSKQGGERIGERAPAWNVEFAAGHGPALEELAGRVVFLRFWTDTCPFCRASAPALVALDARYRDRGVTVIGMHHPKPRGTSRSRQEVAAAAAELGFSFPIGLDTDWRVLDDYWLSLGGRRFTSASFVIDRAGVIRFVHPGPEFHDGGDESHAQCREDFAAICQALDHLLIEV